MSINELEVQMSSEHIDSNAKVSPKEAIKELIWNACDADATSVSVSLSINTFAGESIEEIKVIDNGHGLCYEDLEDILGYYGRSSKTHAAKSPMGRLYHGKLGHGRYKSFSLGRSVRWESVYLANDGKKYSFFVNFDAARKTKVACSEKSLMPEDKTTGMTVTISGIDEPLKGLMDASVMQEELVSTFAAYLLAYPSISVAYDSLKVNPHDFFQETVSVDLESAPEHGEMVTAKNTIILWQSNFKKESNKLYICGTNGVAYMYEELRIKGTRGHSLSAYLSSGLFDELQQQHMLEIGNIADKRYGDLIIGAQRTVRNFVNERFCADAVEEVKSIKESEIYPYSEESSGTVETVERQCFDLLSVEINNIVPSLRNATNETKKLTYRLIKEAVKTNPDSLSDILIEVFNLSQEKQDELAALLKHTSLPSIINMAQTISNRLLFIHALEQMVYNKDVGKSIRERTQFHKILLGELWIFGEKYALGASDLSLKNVLKSYISHLGRSELSPVIPEAAAADIRLIPDLCLWSQYPVEGERIVNLVIELKRPTKTLTTQEVSQIENYAYAIADDNRFPKDNTRWDFLLLGCDFDEYVTRRLRDRKDGVGNLYNSDDGSISISVRRWSELIQENKLKLGFLKDKLNYSLEDSQPALDYLYTKYKDMFEKKEKK